MHPEARIMFSAILVVGALGFGLTVKGEETRLEALGNLDLATMGHKKPVKDKSAYGQPLQIAGVKWKGTSPKLVGTIGFSLPAEPESMDPVFAGLNPAKAPVPSGLYLKVGDRLAICGDSITQQTLYSRIIETYLTVCVPELKITARQYGWSGETAEGFLRRMTNDCLRFKPTIATTCYGMNDFRYRPYDEVSDKWCRENITAVVKAFKDEGARVIVGSPGCVGKVCSWVASIGTLEQHNQHLCMLHNIDIEVAAKERVRFADVFCPHYAAGVAARQKYGADYAIAGKDGIHPGLAGHLVMAYAFLQAMGLDGNLGKFTVDLGQGTASASAGHKVEEFKNGALTLMSTRYPFCAAGRTNDDNSVRSGMTLVPFNEKLNRLMLVVKGGKAADYKVTWGAATVTYTARQLAAGVNLAADFEVNPFSEAFRKVDDAVGGKEGFEIGQIRQVVHSAIGKSDKEADIEKSELEHAKHAQAIQAAFVPVRHTLKIEP